MRCLFAPALREIKFAAAQSGHSGIRMTFKVNSKSILRRAAHEVGARTHYLADRFEQSRKSAAERMVAIRKRRLSYEGHTVKIVHTLVDGRQVKHTIEVSAPARS